MSVESDSEFFQTDFPAAPSNFITYSSQKARHQQGSLLSSALLQERRAPANERLHHLLLSSAGGMGRWEGPAQDRMYVDATLGVGEQSIAQIPWW